MRFVELVTAHARAVSALRGRRNKLHNFFILNVHARLNGGRSNPAEEMNLASRMKQRQQKAHSVLYKLPLLIVKPEKNAPRAIFPRRADVNRISA